MAMSIASLSRSGMRDWLVQRVSAIFMLLYLTCLGVYFLRNGVPTYDSWHAVFSSRWMRVTSLLFVLNLLLHTWIGIWTVSTDYIKPKSLRLVFQVLVILLLVGYAIWGIEIAWGVA